MDKSYFSMYFFLELLSLEFQAKRYMYDMKRLTLFGTVVGGVFFF